MGALAIAGAVVDTAKGGTDRAIQLNQAKINKLDNQIDNIQLQAEIDDECERPNTAVLACMIEGINTAVEILPAMDAKLDNMRIYLDLIYKNTMVLSQNNAVNSFFRGFRFLESFFDVSTRVESCTPQHSTFCAVCCAVFEN